jgi:hypothetical protein
MNGRVLGISQIVLGTLKAAQANDGAMPQNVNFAISAIIAVNFLQIKNIDPKTDLSPTVKLEPELLAEEAKKYTVQVFCE